MCLCGGGPEIGGGGRAGGGAGVPELAGSGGGGVAAHQQVTPVQVSVLKFTRLLRNCQAQSSLQAAYTHCSALIVGFRRAQDNLGRGGGGRSGSEGSRSMPGAETQHNRW